MANDALEGAAQEGIVERNGYSDGCSLRLQLHDAMTAALAHGDKTIHFEYLAGFHAGENSQPTQRALQPA